VTRRSIRPNVAGSDPERAEIDRQIVEAYTRQPQTDEEVAGVWEATCALIEAEPW
jgi:hypothetical protein